MTSSCGRIRLYEQDDVVVLVVVAMKRNIHDEMSYSEGYE